MKLLREIQRIKSEGDYQGTDKTGPWTEWHENGRVQLKGLSAKGLREGAVIYKHALKNALIPLVSIMALNLAALFSGAVITETVFAWPGIGRMFVTAMLSRDYPLLMGILMLGSVMVVVFNLVADLVYGALDPRIRYD